MIASGPLSLRNCTLAGLLLVLAPIARAQEAKEEWKLDVVRLKDGEIVRGLVLDNGADSLRLRVVIRRPGRPVVTSVLTLKRARIQSVELLPDADREILRKRLSDLATERQTWGLLLQAIDPKEKKQSPSEIDKLDFRQVPWSQGGQALGYQSENFELISNARDDLVWLTAIQLELIHEAYRKYLPARVDAAHTTTVLLPRSRKDYEALLKHQGLGFANIAYFDVAQNQIVCPSDLQRLADEWYENYRKVYELKTKLEEQRRDLKRLYGRVPPDLEERLDKDFKKLAKVNADQRRRAEEVLSRLFQPLYHEAFHAYLSNYVYLPAENDVPRWLNEGLAQIFETAILEAGELHVERPDTARLAQAQQLLLRGELVPLPILLRSGGEQFQVAHNTDKQASDRHYLASWALAWYLTFDRKLLGTKELNAYVRKRRREADPLAAFQELVGQPLAEFEQAFRGYLKELRPDGKIK